MSELREAAEEALRWMEHARLHLTIKERMHPDGLGLYDSATEALRAALAQPKTVAFKLGDIVEKVRGSEWVGTVCGTYSTDLTPEGYCVESLAHVGSVQIYPATALKLLMLGTRENGENL